MNQFMYFDYSQEYYRNYIYHNNKVLYIADIIRMLKNWNDFKKNSKIMSLQCQMII